MEKSKLRQSEEAAERLRKLFDEIVVLPRDADGEVIRIGDELCGYGRPQGGVRCKALVNERTVLVGTDDEPYRDWLMWDTKECRHYHKPKVEDLLLDFAKKMHDASFFYDYVENTQQTIVKEYAQKLQLKEDE